MNNVNKKLAEIFDVTPIDITNIQQEEKETSISLLTENAPQKIETLDGDLVDAYEKSKTNIEDVIEQGKEAIEKMLEIAKDSQHPRAFEVFGNLLEKIVVANKELIAIQREIREITEHKEPNKNTTIDKAIFIGSTTELNKLLKGEDNDTR